MKVSVIGLGQMGSRMAERLLDAGHQVAVWNRNPTKSSSLVERGAVAARNPAAAASTGVVLTMLADDHAVEAVTLGEDGIFNAGPGILHLSCSTISTELTERLTEMHARAGQRFISCQMLGRPDVAAAGNLVVMVGGDLADLDAVRPILDAISSKTIHIGERPIMAAAAKLAANLGVSTIIQMLTEQFRIAGVHGVAPSKIVELLKEAEYGNRLVNTYAHLIAEQRFEPVTFALELGRKDIELARRTFDEGELPLADLLAERMDEIIANGGGKRDLSTLGQ